MIKKTTISLLILVFISSLLFTISCRKKVEPAPPVTTPSDEEQERIRKEREEREREEAERRRRQRMAEEERQRQEEQRRDQERARQARQLMMEVESEKIYFDYDRSDLKPESRAILSKKAEWLKANSGYKIRIEGHCDERGSLEYNLALGERRAEAASQFLKALGVSGDRITTVSYGEQMPVDPGHNETAWVKNRRDEFKLEG